jgi:transposase
MVPSDQKPETQLDGIFGGSGLQPLALTQGILAPVGWWRPAAWKQFKTQLPQWMDSQLEHWQEQALAIDAKERQVRRELEKMVGIELPIGVGALSWITLQLEIRGWERFQNRRQIASYTGLCPGIHNSNGRGREGHINRCGNSVVRYTLIETVWRMTRWQPDYPPIKKLRSMANGCHVLFDCGRRGLALRFRCRRPP